MARNYGFETFRAAQKVVIPSGKAWYPAVQEHVNLVELELCFKMSICIENYVRYSRERDAQNLPKASAALERSRSARTELEHI